MSFPGPRTKSNLEAPGRVSKPDPPAPICELINESVTSISFTVWRDYARGHTRKSQPRFLPVHGTSLDIAGKFLSQASDFGGLGLASLRHRKPRKLAGFMAGAVVGAGKCAGRSEWFVVLVVRGSAWVRAAWMMARLDHGMCLARAPGDASRGVSLADGCRGERDTRVGFGVRLGVLAIPTFALRLPPAEVQGALQG
jgi:hypothetical protein